MHEHSLHNLKGIFEKLKTRDLERFSEVKAKIANLTGRSPSTINRIISGDVPLTDTYAHAFIKALGLKSFDDLFIHPEYGQWKKFIELAEERGLKSEELEELIELGRKGK